MTNTNEAAPMAPPEPPRPEESDETPPPAATKPSQSDEDSGVPPVPATPGQQELSDYHDRSLNQREAAISVREAQSAQRIQPAERRPNAPPGTRRGGRSGGGLKAPAGFILD